MIHQIKQMAKDLLRWRSGRQSSGYEKMLLATAPWPVAFDLYLLRFKKGAQIPFHRDPAPKDKRGRTMRHYRLNIFLRNADKGGVFQTRTDCADDKHRLFSASRVELFRPDLLEHSVTEVEDGTRYVLSLGWLRRPE
jgi:hypothetical protein